MNGTNGTSKYPAELRERAIRMVWEHKGAYASEWAAIESIAAKLGIAAPETLRKWVRRAEVDGGQRPGVTTAERERLVQLERENRELRRANEILRAAASFFARELDPRPPKP
jgi:transposase